MKLKKLCVSLMCGIILLGGSNCIPVSASIIGGAEPLAVAARCPKCIYGSISTTTRRVYQHDERFDCSHGKTGKDTYGVYEVKITTHCDSCSYSKVEEYEDHVLKKCNGK